MTIHTISTKCQYKPISSTTSALSPGTLLREMIPTSDISMTMPTDTWMPWKPVRVKKLELNKLVVKPTPSWQKEVNSYTCAPTKVDPSKTVTESHRHVNRSSRCCAALTASTMVRELINKMKLDTDVSGMSHSWAGPGVP